MKFSDAVAATASIRGHLRTGLSGIRNADRPRLHCQKPQRLTGSIDLDTALRRSHPQAARWDYVIGLRENSRSDYALWIEVHPASSHHVGEVLSKLDWLKDWLRTEGASLKRLPGAFHWVATGRISFRRGSPQEKRIARQGLHFPVKRLNF